MKTKLKYLVSVMVLTACTSHNAADRPSGSLHTQPQTVEVNVTEGYTINPVTGDSIKPLLNTHGEIIKTGVSTPAIGTTIHPDSITQPKVVPLRNPTRTINARPYVHTIPDNLNVIPINHDALTTIFIDELPNESTLHYLITNTGDTVKTGFPIPASGKKVKTIQPAPTRALLPRFKEAAIKNMQYLDVDQGMPSSEVLSILEDQNGNLWFGTSNEGVSRYDGATFTHFTTKEGLSSNTVMSILEDKNGDLWFATWGGGVSRYDGESFTHFTTNEGLSSNDVVSILEDQNGNLWFATWVGGVTCYDGQSFTHFTTNEGLSGNRVRSVLEDTKGNLWFGTYQGGVNRYDGKSFTHFTTNEGLSHNHIRAMCEDQNGNLWFGTIGGGVNRYDGKSFTHFTTQEGLSHDHVSSIHKDQSGNLWFGTERGGLNYYDGKRFTHITTQQGLSNNNIETILADRKGNLWFGTNGGGANRYDDKSFTHFKTKEGLSHIAVYSILEDQKGNLWFGTEGGGVNQYDGKNFTHYTTEEGLSGNRVRSILEDQNGNLWFGIYQGGVNRYDGKSFTHFTTNEGLSNNVVWSILEDQKGNLWFATEGGGVTRYDGKTFTHYTTEEGLITNNVTSILEDQNGNLWLASHGGGVTRYDGQNFIHFTTKEGLSSNLVTSILEDQNGNLWFGTEGGGLNRYDGKSFTHFTTREGLSNNLVKSILEDQDGNIWIATNNGINLLTYQPIDDNQSKKAVIRIIKKNDGLRGLDFFTNSTLLDSQNQIWWGSGKSLTMLDMTKYKTTQEQPIVSLKYLKINDQFIDYRNITDSLAKRITFDRVEQFENYPLNLSLQYNQNHLTFHFSAIDWAAPHAIKYSYLLEGLNKKWSQPSSETKTDYRNLTYGTYTFKIRAIGKSGKWSDTFEYSFTIHPPWWHTWWARIGYALLSILVILLIIRWRTASLQQRQKQLEIEVDNATQEIRLEKERSEQLLLNILPEEVAAELKDKGHADAQLIEQVTVLFTDFKGFIALSEQVTPRELVADLHACFSKFDRICEKYGIEKIKTIGDAYMAAGGLPTPNQSHAEDIVKAALDMVEVVRKGKIKKIANNLPFFEVRIGVHTGPVVAGIVGLKKFQYDIWGDTVNTASRIENQGAVGKVNISSSTYEILKNDPYFIFENRGKIQAKGKGEIEMYFVSKGPLKNNPI